MWLFNLFTNIQNIFLLNVLFNNFFLNIHEINFERAVELSDEQKKRPYLVSFFILLMLMVVFLIF
jgi:hypothetical protein